MKRHSPPAQIRDIIRGRHRVTLVGAASAPHASCYAARRLCADAEYGLTVFTMRFVLSADAAAAEKSTPSIAVLRHFHAAKKHGNAYYAFILRAGTRGCATTRC